MKSTRRQADGEEKEAGRGGDGGTKWMARGSSEILKKRKKSKQRELKGGNLDWKRTKRAAIWSDRRKQRFLKKMQRWTKATSGKWEWEPCGQPGEAYILSALWRYESSQTTRAPGIWPRSRSALSWTGCSSPACRGLSQPHRACTAARRKTRISTTRSILFFCTTEVLSLLLNCLTPPPPSFHNK